MKISEKFRGSQGLCWRRDTVISDNIRDQKLKGSTPLTIVPCSRDIPYTRRNFFIMTGRSTRVRVAGRSVPAKRGDWPCIEWAAVKRNGHLSQSYCNQNLKKWLKPISRMVHPQLQTLANVFEWMGMLDESKWCERALYNHPFLPIFLYVVPQNEMVSTVNSVLTFKVNGWGVTVVGQ
jgi:hypothetical protein